MEITNIKAKDFCCFGELDLPLANNGLVWVSGVNNDSEAASSNGSGKTTIFKILVWGLYGNTIDGERGDNVIRAGCKKASVDIELANKEGTWTIQRTRKKGTTKLDLLLPGGKAFKASTKELQQKIIDLLGLDFLAFRNTVLYGQNDINRFTNSKTSDSDRKEMLHCILRSNIFSACREFVREDKSRLDADIKDKESGIGQLEARIQEYDLDDLKDKSNGWIDKHNNKLDGARALVESATEEVVIARDKLITVGDLEDEVKAMRSQMDKRNTDIDEIDAHMVSITKGREEKISKLRDAQKVVEEDKRATEKSHEVERNRLSKAYTHTEKALVDKKDKLVKKRHEVDMVIAEQNLVLGGLNDSLSKLNGDICPTCNTSLKDGGVDKYRNNLLLKMELADDKCQKAKVILSKIETAIKQIHVDMAKGKEDLEKQYEVLRGTLKPIMDDHEKKTKDLEGQIDSLGQSGEDISVSIEKQNKLREEVVELSQEAQKVLDVIAGLEKEESNAQERLGSANKQLESIESEEDPYLSLFEEAKTKTDKYAKELKTLSKRVVALRKDLAYAEFWSKGFSNQGVASYVLDSVMPYLTDRANHYLEILADGDIKVLFSTQKELKSSKNEYRDKIDITWMIEGQETSYPPSGGQAKKIEIATDLALMDLVTYREGHNTNILILDEVLDGLDETGRQRVLQLLQEVNKYRNTVFVISHDSNMSEVFESYITVEKNEGVSHIKHLSLP